MCFFSATQFGAAFHSSRSLVGTFILKVSLTKVTPSCIMKAVGDAKTGIKLSSFNEKSSILRFTQSWKAYRPMYLTYVVVRLKSPSDAGYIWNAVSPRDTSF